MKNISQFTSLKMLHKEQSCKYATELKLMISSDISSNIVNDSKCANMKQKYMTHV
jgi:hypothetical protein